MTTMPLGAAVAALVLLLPGCGSTIEVGGDVTEPDPSSGPASDGPTDLTITVQPGPGHGERRWTLTCDPPGGTHPSPEAACRLLESPDDPLAPVPRDAICTEIYGGDQTATVTGTLRGEPVTARFSRVDGCEIARWDRHRALLVEAGGVEVR